MNPIHGALFGLAIGDALGVPAEFTSRATLQQQPIDDFIGYKSHNQPSGTFSDDSSLTFCLAESLCQGYNLHDIARRFIDWNDNAYWTAHNEVFDIGITTQRAIERLKRGTTPDIAGDIDEMNNGNGSLMRIMPLLFYARDFDIEKRYQLIKEVSSITHGHIRSVIACFYYLEFARELLGTKDKFKAYESTAKNLLKFLPAQRIDDAEIYRFQTLLAGDIAQVPYELISSSGYVLHTLFASMYCLMTTNNYKDAVLTAVNLGEDTDTTGAVTGGLAGLYYGYESIPKTWRTSIARANDISDLCDRLAKATQL